MILDKINGNTNYIKGATNIGVYTYKNKNSMLIDTGYNNSQGRRIDGVLQENKLHPKFIINTHSHLDHIGGNHYFKENYPGVLIYVSERERLCMEYSEIGDLAIFTALPINSLERSTKLLKADYILSYGINKIGDEKFDIKSLSGHSIESVGIITPDRVCFLGDAIFSEEIIKKYGLPYIMDVEACYNSLKSIKEMEADYFVVSHGGTIYSREEIVELVDINIQNLDNQVMEIRTFLQTPLTREELLENMAIMNEFKMNYKQYHLYFSSISAFIAYLLDKGEINYSLENGKLFYYVKQ